MWIFPFSSSYVWMSAHNPLTDLQKNLNSWFPTMGLKGRLYGMYPFNVYIQWRPKLFVDPILFVFNPKFSLETQRFSIFLFLNSNFGSPMKIWGLQWKSSALQWKSWGLLKILGFSNENLEVSKENLGSPMKFVRSPMNIWGSKTIMLGLNVKLGVSYDNGGFYRKSGVSNESLECSNENLWSPMKSLGSLIKFGGR